jgi:thermostable 8-oxoguanine DNA glycosylase
MKKFMKVKKQLKVNPTDITDFNRDTNQLESFWLFCMFVAGKNSDYASRCLSKLIHGMSKRGYDGIFNYFKDLGRDGIHNALVANKVGQYGRLTKGIMQSLDLDLERCNLDALLDIHGVGNKTARFFLLHTRIGCEYAVLDTHILKWMRGRGEDVPKSTPTRKTVYRKLERRFLYLSRLAYPFLTDSQIDLLIWSEQSGRISSEEAFDMEFPFESRDGVDD